jgi:hypothetical protein
LKVCAAEGLRAEDDVDAEGAALWTIERQRGSCATVVVDEEFLNSSIISSVRGMWVSGLTFGSWRNPARALCGTFRRAESVPSMRRSTLMANSRSGRSRRRGRRRCVPLRFE